MSRLEDKTIGIVTCGGDCPGVNAVLRAIVKSGIGKYNYNFLGYRGGFKGLMKNDFIHLKMADVSGILDVGGTILGTSSNDILFDLQSGDSADSQHYISTIKDNMAMHDMLALIVIGGDEAMKAAQYLSEAGINVVVVPKSINNNVLYTDMTLGCSTAVCFATDEIDKLHMTAETEHQAIIVEVAGDKTGWIATKAGIAGGADVILVPEIKYDIRKVARSILERKNNGKNFSIVVVAEGARSVDAEKDDDKVCAETIRVTESEKLKRSLNEIIDIECEVVVLGKILRCGRPCSYDRVLATQEGAYAVEMINNEMFGKGVCLRNDEITCEKISMMIEGIKEVTKYSDLVEVAKSLGVTFGD